MIEIDGCVDALIGNNNRNKQCDSPRAGVNPKQTHFGTNNGNNKPGCDIRGEREGGGEHDNEANFDDHRRHQQ